MRWMEGSEERKEGRKEAGNAAKSLSQQGWLATCGLRVAQVALLGSLFFFFLFKSVYGSLG